MGRKPAIYDTVLSKPFLRWLPILLEKYPYIDKGIELREDTTFYMFFQNEELKQSFQNQLKEITVPSPDFHRILGLALGYPPKAVEFYVQCERDPSLRKFKVGMHYQGVPCNGSVYDLVENCNWLWEKYTFDGCSKEPLEVRIGYNMHKVEKGDIHRLRELQEIALARTSVINT